MVNVEQQAEELTKDLGFAFPIQPNAVCKLLSSASSKINYNESKLSEDLFGTAIGYAGNVEIIVNSNILNPSKRLFTAAHEIGHVVLHILTNKKLCFKCLGKDILETTTNNNLMEKEANAFAAPLLMPKHLLVEKKVYEEDVTWYLVNRVAKEFNTSLEATARRIINTTDELYALIIHHNNSMWTPVKSKKLGLFIQRTNFPKWITPVDIDEVKKQPERLEECDLSDWGIETSQASSKINCRFSSIEDKQNNRIMTLLLFNDMDEEDSTWEEPVF